MKKWRFVSNQNSTIVGINDAGIETFTADMHGQQELDIIQKIKDLLRFQNWQVLMKNIQEIVLELIYMYLAYINQKNIKKNLFELCC